MRACLPALVGLAACGSAGDPYWTRMCVSADETVMLAGGDHVHVIDLADGSQRSRKRMYTDDVLCRPDGALVVISHREAVWIDGDQRLPHDMTVPAAATLPDGRLVYSVHPMDSSRSSIRHHAFHQDLVIAEPGRLEAAVRHQMRAPAFGSAEDTKDFQVRIIGARADGIVVDAPVDDKHRRFFRLDPATGKAEPIGPPRDWMDKAELHALSPDGSFAAGWAGTPGAPHAATIGIADESYPHETGLDGPSEITAVAIRGDGRAVAYAGRDDTGSMVIVRDARTHYDLWHTDMQRDEIRMLRFLRDGSLVVAGPRLSAALYGPDGALRWRRP